MGAPPPFQTRLMHRRRFILKKKSCITGGALKAGSPPTTTTTTQPDSSSACVCACVCVCVRAIIPERIAMILRIEHFSQPLGELVCLSYQCIFALLRQNHRFLYLCSVFIVPKEDIEGGLGIRWERWDSGMCFFVMAQPIFYI
ncbi:hypothetical protein ACOME3_009684 [Neoechinorhynchus agilis]